MSNATMKAVRIHRYGGPEVLVYEDAPRPEPGPGDVLIQVHAAGVNPADRYIREGFLIMPEEKRPKLAFPFTPGADVSGVVAAVGSGVTEFRDGDAVFGMPRFRNLDNGGKAYAEYTTAPAQDLAKKPDAIDHVHAAAIPLAALTAYQFLFEFHRLERGQTVLVNGAAGGVGHFVVQLAKMLDARVIGVASGRHEAFLRELGVDRFVDYTTTNVADLGSQVDLVVDNVGGPDGRRFLPLVKRGGRIMPVFYGDYHEARAAELGITVFRGGVHSDGAHMKELARFIEQGKLRAEIDSVFPLSEASKAHERSAAGHVRGKIVLRVR